MSDPLKEAMAVLDAYMAGLNRGDEAAVNAACNFPHVRLAGGKVVVWPNHGDYKLEDFRARAGDGWATEPVGRAHAHPCRLGQGASEGGVQPLAQGWIADRPLRDDLHRDPSGRSLGHTGALFFRVLSACGLWAGLARVRQGNVVSRRGYHADPQSTCSPAPRRWSRCRWSGRPPRRRRSSSASSTATRSFRPSSSPTRRAGSWRSRRSTRRAACSAARSRSSAATTTAIPATPCASPRSC